MEFRKKRKAMSSREILFKTAGFGMLALVLVLVVADVKIYRKRKELLAQKIFYENQIKELQESNQKIKKQIENSENSEYLEKIAYEQLNEQKPGEKGIIFIMPEQEALQQSENFWEPKAWTGWLSRTWGWLFTFFKK